MLAARLERVEEELEKIEPGRRERRWVHGAPDRDLLQPDEIGPGLRDLRRHPVHTARDVAGVHDGEDMGGSEDQRRRRRRRGPERKTAGRPGARRAVGASSRILLEWSEAFR